MWAFSGDFYPHPDWHRPGYREHADRLSPPVTGGGNFDPAWAVSQLFPGCLLWPILVMAAIRPQQHRLMSIESVMPSSHLILCRPLLLLPPIPPRIRVFFSELTLRMRWPKYWSFRFSIIPSKEIPGLTSFRMDWLDLLSVQGTLKSLLNTTVQKHQFCSVQLSSQSSSDIHS